MRNAVKFCGEVNEVKMQPVMKNTLPMNENWVKQDLQIISGRQTNTPLLNVVHVNELQ